MSEGPVIWVVEDDLATQRLLAYNLRKQGFSPVIYETAEKAYAALQFKGLPSLIILDMLLPGMSGVDLIRLIKQHPEWNKIPVVVVSVVSRDGVESEEAETAAYWVNKPFDTDSLIQTIQGILASVR